MSPRPRAPGDGEVVPHPDRLGRYQVLLPIASGGMATVYLARAVGMAGFEREVALKLTHGHLRDDPAFVTALIDEARLAGRIQHPNVVSVLDVGEDPSGVYVVMDYVEGDSLSNLVRTLGRGNAKLPLPIALRILDDVLLGLQAAHELADPDGAPLGVVHRDVTPHNVLVGVDGGARLTDFGIAKARDRLVQTSSGQIKGKLAYMSPEQARGETLDARCDVWAAGVMAWELVTGLRLFDAPNDAAILLKVVGDPPPRLSDVAPELPNALDEAVAGALSRELAARWPSADAFARALRDGARASGVPIAEVREVAEYVRPVFASKLASRRQKARQMSKLRRRIEHLSALPSSPSQPTPVEDGSTTTELSSHNLITIGSPREKGDRESSATGNAALAKSTTGPTRGASTRAVWLLAVIGAAGLIVGALSLAKSRAEPASESAATSATAAATSSGVRASPAPEPSAAPPEQPSAEPAPLLASASASARVAAPRASAGRPSPAVAPRKGNCNPPYVVDARGIQIFKPECL